MAERIKRREDVNPDRGEHEYGDVSFADPVNKKYPIDTPSTSARVELHQPRGQRGEVLQGRGADHQGPDQAGRQGTASRSARIDGRTADTDRSRGPWP